MRSLKSFRDPAPSRSAYKINRLLLTPSFWWVVKYVLPVVLIVGPVTWYLSQEEHREAIRLELVDLRRQIEQRPEFMVEVMAIDGASIDVSEDIRQIIPIDFPVSSFDLNLEQLKARAEELDAVAEADVRIRGGGVLHIDIVERTPAVIWRSRDALELLDEGGRRVADLGARTDRPELPLLAGDGADQAVEGALSLIRTAAPIADRLRGLVRVGERRWDVVLDNDQRILLPETGADAALARVLAMDAARDLLSRDIGVIDMRNPDRLTLRLSESAITRLQGAEITQTGASLE